MDLAREVSVKEAYQWNDGIWDLEKGYTSPGSAKYRVVACDYGVKHNILRILADRGCDITVVPAQASAEEILSFRPDGVFL